MNIRGVAEEFAGRMERDNMRKIRVAVILFFIISCICFGLYCWTEWKYADRNAPVLQLESEVLKVSASATEEELLAGVTAQDVEDGDLTDRVQIASLSPLIGGSERTIRYIVFDSADQVATATRTLIYTDYESPRIYLKDPLRFAAEGLSAGIGSVECYAEDMIDGDLTNKMRITYSSYSTMPEGQYEIILQVNNSAGDTCIVPMELAIVNREEEAGKFYPLLSDYIVYTKVGEELDEEVLLLGVTYNGAEYLFEEDAESGNDSETEETGAEGGSTTDINNTSQEDDKITVRDIRIRSHVNYDKVGIYTVEYSYTSPEEITAVTTLYVVVEEGK